MRIRDTRITPTGTGYRAVLVVVIGLLAAAGARGAGPAGSSAIHWDR